MKSVQLARLVLLGGLLVGGVAVAGSPANGPGLAALRTIEPGEWQLREKGSTARPTSLCVADPRILLQLRHPDTQCARFVISDTPTTSTIHYTCAGAGHGRTTVTVETPRLIDIQTQGIAGGAPFDFDYEARRSGGCGSAGYSGGVR